jgi:hypothetical protein
MVSVAVAAVVPERATEGVIEQVAGVATAGAAAMLQVSATFPVKPATGVTVTVVLPLVPCNTLIAVFVAPLSVNGACPVNPMVVETLPLYAVSPG